MFILAREEATAYSALLNYLPPPVRSLTMTLDACSLEEIRLRKEKPLTVCMSDGNYVVDRMGKVNKHTTKPYIVTKTDITTALEIISRGSLYSLENEIKQGFITIAGGHRIGIVGKAVIKDSQISYIKDISGLNYRFAKQILGVADCIIDRLICDNSLKNTLIVSPPQCGKTTLLRDIARQLSCMDYKVSIIDERSEIAGVVDGVSSYDVGVNTDVFDSCPKATGMNLVLRSMSPQVLITDEIGTEADIEAIQTALSCGVAVIASIHAASRSDLLIKPRFTPLLALFERIITLSKRRGSGTIEEVYAGVD